MFVYAWASGEIEIAAVLPKGALPIFKGQQRQCERVQQRGRLAYDGKTWFVPGIPEADGQIAALDALIAFKKWAAK